MVRSLRNVKKTGWGFFSLMTPVTPLTVGLDYLTGTEQEAERNTNFNLVCGANHKFYGLMDT